MALRPYTLPDGRVLLAAIADESGGDSPELRPLWELQIEGQEGAVSVGHPLNSTLAKLFGWNVDHEEWPRWVDQLAQRIEAD